MRAWRMMTLVALVAASLVVPTTAVRAAPGFIEAQGTQLTLDGEPFRFTGLNVYNANSDGWCWFEYSDTEFAQALIDMGPGVNVIRAWFFQPLATTPAGVRDWTRFDRTLQIAGQHGIRVIVTLTDQWGECGSTGANPFKDRAWYEGGYETEVLPDATVPYRDWVSEVVTRYKDDPNVAFWQLINEAEVNEVIGGVQQACPPGNEPADILRNWAQDVGGLVKSIDANHLVSLGTIGNGQCGAQGAQYQSVHDIPEIDLCEYHDYGSPSVGIPGDQFNGLQVRLDQCAAIDKPLFVGEAGIDPDEVGGTLQARADAFAAKIDAQFDAGVVGFLAWAWSSMGSTTDNYDIGPNDPTLDVLATSTTGRAIVQLATGSEHTCALTSDGGVWCWGNNSNGQLGDGTTAHRQVPTQVSGIPGDIVSISAGGEHSCAVTGSGAAWCWGTNQNAQLGSGGGSPFQGPTLVPGIPSDVVTIDTGGAHTCVLTGTGSVWCWGYNLSGQTGNGSTSSSAPPAQVVGMSGGVNEIAIGGYHSCARVGSEVKCWGSDQRGQAGDGGSMEFSIATPVDVVGLASDTRAIASGTYQSCALAIGGGVSCWGHGEFGELGNGQVVNQAGAVPVSGLTDADDITGGMNRGGGSGHTCALTGGGARCWGSNGSGQLGDGTIAMRSEPVPVLGLPGQLQSIEAGGNHTCVIVTAWSVKCWGANSYGQLGDGTTTDRHAPVDVIWVAASDEPDAPTNVQATAGDSEATVTWTPPSSDGGSPITGYTITSEPDGISVSVGPGVTQAVVPSLTNGTPYTFTVVATNAVGDSQASAPSNSVTPHAIDPPTEPRTPVATAGDQSATVTWLAPISDGGDPIDSYTVTSNVGGFSQTVVGTQLSATITGLTNGTPYRFRVYATNAAGDGPASVLSNAVTPRAVPGPPRNVTATPGPARVTVSWTPPASNGGGAINGYIVTATSSSGTVTKTVAGGTTSTNITGLTNGVTYAITVAARNVVGTGPASSPVDVTPIGVPGAPTGVTAVAGNGSASITWTPPASTGGSPITGYTVTSNVGGFSITVGGSETSVLISGLTNGVAYRFRVFATNAVGNGPPSAYSIAVTPRGVPGTPTGVAATPGNASATVGWAAPPTGGSPITAYIVTSSGGQSTTVPGNARSALVGGLTNGVGYTFTVVARNAIGDGPPGSTSTPVTPSSSVTPIVFSSNRPGSDGQDIYVMNSDGSGVVRIVGRAGPDLLPALSPDGTRVVFASGVDTALEIWMVNIDGSGLTQLTCNAVADSDPDWSPDGTRIAFLSLRAGPSRLRDLFDGSAAVWLGHQADEQRRCGHRSVLLTRWVEDRVLVGHDRQPGDLGS